MFVYKELTAMDLLRSNLVNLDEKTASFSLDFYFRYLNGNSNNCCAVSYNKDMAGYIIGCHEYEKNKPNKYTHITALSVSPMYRKCRIGAGLLRIYEVNSRENKSEYIDLFVRVSNTQAIEFYTKNGYVVHRTIENYYCDPSENAYDMRKYEKVSKRVKQRIRAGE